MPGTGSIPTAMRWRWSSAAVVALLAAACVTRTTTYFTPTAGEARLTQDDLRDESDDFLAIECPRLMGSSRSATGQARIRVHYDRSGAVQRAEITKASGDDQIDAVWGALAARLQFEPQAGQTEDLRPGILTFGYSCAPGIATTTLQLPQ
jgi:TonB family protein